MFDPAASHTGVNVLLGVYAFAFQIYGDFAGYSNIARGTSKLMGIELIENFRFPYLVRTPQAFWRNWHISLSMWLRDYLYIPLGGNRGSEWQTQRNLFITMVLGGLWHGAAWTFVLWGAYQGLFLIGYRAADRWPPFHRFVAGAGFLARLTSWVVMFHLTCYGWLIFRSRSTGQIGGLTAGLIGNFAPSTVDIPNLLVPLLLYSTPLAGCTPVRGVVRRRVGRTTPAGRRAILHLRCNVLSHAALRKLRRRGVHLFPVLTA